MVPLFRAVAKFCSTNRLFIYINVGRARLKGPFRSANFGFQSGNANHLLGLRAENDLERNAKQLALFEEGQ